MSTISAGTTSTTTLIATGDTTGSLVLKTNDTGSGGTTAMTIDTSQNVGIGTTSPTAVLHTIGPNGSYATTLAESVTYTKLRFQNSSASSLSLYQGVVNSSNATWYFQVANGPGTGSYDISLAPFGGNVGIGTTSPVAALSVSKQTTALSGTSQPYGVHIYPTGSGLCYIDALTSSSSNTSLGFRTYNNGTYNEVRIDSSGGLRVGTTSNIFNAASSEKFSVKNTSLGCAATFQITDSTGGYPIFYLSSLDTTNASQNTMLFYRSGSVVGSITTTASATAFNTSSDYRLKENIAPMTGALSVVQQLKPCTYTWKTDGSAGQGFIAHELQAVVPDCVTGEKDAVNEDGSIKPQGIDTSFLVATLTAAIQELKALNDAQASTITQLTERISALENK